MDISFVIPVYNEHELVVTAVESLLQQCYQGGTIEIVVVNDGSTDGTREALDSLLAANDSNKSAKHTLRIFHLEENKGRAHARYFGAKQATHHAIVLFDSRLFAKPDFLNSLVADFPIVMVGNVEQQKPSWIGTTLELLRRQTFSVYYKASASSEPYYHITAENFDSSPKGTTCLFFTDKNTFLHASDKMDIDDKHVSEDIRLLRILVEDGKSIVKNRNSTVYYAQRTSIGENFIHLYERGPRFVEYYHEHHPLYRCLMYVGLLLAAAFLLTALIHPGSLFFIITLLSLVLVIVLIADRVSTSPLERVQVTCMLPLIVIAFGLGVCKGLAIHWRKQAG